MVSISRNTGKHQPRPQARYRSADKTYLIREADGRVVPVGQPSVFARFGVNFAAAVEAAADTWVAYEPGVERDAGYGRWAEANGEDAAACDNAWLTDGNGSDLIDAVLHAVDAGDASILKGFASRIRDMRAVAMEDGDGAGRRAKMAADRERNMRLLQNAARTQWPAIDSLLRSASIADRAEGHGRIAGLLRGHGVYVEQPLPVSPAEAMASTDTEAA